MAWLYLRCWVSHLLRVPPSVAASDEPSFPAPGAFFLIAGSARVSERRASTSSLSELGLRPRLVVDDIRILASLSHDLVQPVSSDFFHPADLLVEQGFQLFYFITVG